MMTANTQNSLNADFITYEQALTLKELGYDKRCYAHYNPNGVFMWKILCSDEENDHTLSIKDISEHKADGYIEAPTYQQVFRWFRNEHKLLGYPLGCSGDSYGCSVYEMQPDYNREVYADWGTSSTYEEAELECLKKLIDIIETRKILGTPTHNPDGSKRESGGKL